MTALNLPNREQSCVPTTRDSLINSVVWSMFIQGETRDNPSLHKGFNFAAAVGHKLGLQALTTGQS